MLRQVLQHAFNANWILSADFTLETGMHGYRRYDYPNGISVFRSDNRSSYKALALHLQGNVAKRLSLVANYTLSSAKTWGCVLGELFDYVNGVCDTSNPFGPGDYGPSGEDVTHRGVVAGTFHAPGGFELTTLIQAESARPFVITTADNSARISVNGVPTSLDEFRGTPYIQADLRVSRPFTFHERWTVAPFIEFFNLLNRNNPGANYVTNVTALPVPAAQAASGNVTEICTNRRAPPRRRSRGSANWPFPRAGWAISSGRAPLSGFRSPRKSACGLLSSDSNKFTAHS